MMTETERKELEERLHEVQQRIAQAAREAGRDPKDVLLVAATKMNSAERVQAAIEAGLTACGENRVQELLEKYEQGAYKNADLQFIGTLQSNKVKYLLGKVSLIQSVSSIKLAECIAKEAKKHNICQNILLEVNIGREEAKSGFLVETLENSLEQLSKLPEIHIRGLMAIPPIPTGTDKNSRYFEEMQQLFVDISAKKYDNVSMDYLSMGMTADFEEAIRFGANIVRVGTGIFGRRPYPVDTGLSREIQ